MRADRYNRNEPRTRLRADKPDRRVADDRWREDTDRLDGGEHYTGVYRSDARIRQDVNDAFARQAGLDARDIEVVVHDGEIKLSGTVADMHSKELAEALADGVFGASDVQSHLRVKRERGHRDD